MPTLADLDDPPASRAPGLVLGFVVGLALTAVLVLWLLPSVVGIVLGGARDLDEKLGEQDAFMQAVCTEALVLERDETLCQCVLATEDPALDCQDPWRRWLLVQQGARCAEEATREEARSYCACVETVAASVAESDDDDERRRRAQAYERCTPLPDALDLPPLATLMPAGDG